MSPQKILNPNSSFVFGQRGKKSGGLYIYIELIHPIRRQNKLLGGLGGAARLVQSTPFILENKKRFQFQGGAWDALSLSLPFRTPD